MINTDFSKPNLLLLISSVIEYYYRTGKFSEKDNEFLEKEQIKTTSKIYEIESSSISNWNICQACKLEEETLYISCDAPVSLAIISLEKLIF